jgi:hypothetical protein
MSRTTRGATHLNEYTTDTEHLLDSAPTVPALQDTTVVQNLNQAGLGPSGLGREQ